MSIYIIDNGKMILYTIFIESFSLVSVLRSFSTVRGAAAMKTYETELSF